jgi:Uma2 family endonuclease
MPLYAQQGVKYFWLVDPIEKTLEVYENSSGKWLLLQTYGNDDKVRAVPFDAIEIELSSLWT